MGQWSTQRPQRMQAVVAGLAASFSLRATKPLLFHSRGKSRSGRAIPIMGPPAKILAGSPLKPPTAANRSPTGVPMGAVTTPGVLTAEPSTDTVLLTRGIPVRRYRAMKAAVFTLSTMQPASLGSLPPGTVRPVVS